MAQRAREEGTPRRKQDVRMEREAIRMQRREYRGEKEENESKGRDIGGEPLPSRRGRKKEEQRKKARDKIERERGRERETFAKKEVESSNEGEKRERSICEMLIDRLWPFSRCYNLPFALLRDSSTRGGFLRTQRGGLP